MTYQPDQQWQRSWLPPPATASGIGTGRKREESAIRLHGAPTGRVAAPANLGIGGAILDERVHGKARREVLVPGDAQGAGRRLRVPTQARARAVAAEYANVAIDSGGLERSTASGVKGCR
jgi:hypothetical protein